MNFSLWDDNYWLYQLIKNYFDRVVITKNAVMLIYDIGDIKKQIKLLGTNKNNFVWKKETLLNNTPSTIRRTPKNI